ncbi:MAG: response regulator [Nitrosopumilus sp.]|nr:response regulator [Nitrosopumilus sp.]
MKILIVDDNKETTSALSKYFNSKGFQCDGINDSWKALEQIQKEHFDVILLDTCMPKFTGEQIIKTLATNEVLKNQNIFIFSSKLCHEFTNKDLLRRDGINGILKKPMDPDKILQAITKDFNLHKTTISKTF